jgi:hypothetical protein
LRLLSRIDILQRKIVKNSFKKILIGAASGALVLSFSASPANAAPSLYSLGGATVSGTFSDGSVITATPNQWSLTEGGAAVSTTNTYDWIVCTVAQTTSTTVPANSTCYGDNNKQKILADGTVGSFTASGPFTGASLTLTQTLLGGLNGKYLMVMVNGQASGARGGVFMQTCGPISAGSTCSVSVPATTAGGTTTGGTTTGGATTGGTTAAPTQTAQTAPATVPATIKPKKKLKIGAKSSAGLPVTVTVAGGCKVKPVVKTTKTKVGKKTVKTKTTTAYTVTMGKKKGTTCTITQANAGDATYAPLNSVSTVTIS